MPRLQPSLFRHANRQSPLLATLLPACRTIESAKNELRWIKGHVDETSNNGNGKDAVLARLCHMRGRGVPLQYIIGSQPFGSLDIKCKPGVLIPRSETEAYVCHLADLVNSGQLFGHRALEHEGLNAIDFCTGTGCIPLLLFSSLQRAVRRLNIQGVDISPLAVKLSRENISHNTELGNLVSTDRDKTLQITKADVFDDANIHSLASSRWDILISNPPYISQDVWNHGRGQLGASVRKFEPKLALVPSHDLVSPSGCSHADVFYARLLDVASVLKPKVILFEVGDESQARRVLELYLGHNISINAKAEIWRDWPDFSPLEDEALTMDVAKGQDDAVRFAIKGSGNIRAILIRRTEATRRKPVAREDA